MLVPGATSRSHRDHAGAASDWHVYVFKLHGGASDETANLVAERTISAGAEAAADLSRWLGTWKPAKAIAVLPPSATVCRTCTLPALGAGKSEQLLSALRLQAETAFMGGIPNHRLSMAALPEALSSPAGGSRQGVIIGWPESSDIPAVPALPEYTDLAFTATLSAILGLIGGTPLTEPVVRADRADRSVLFVVGGANGLVLRSTLEDADDDGVWRDGVLRSAAETLISNDATSDEIARMRAVIDEHLRGATSAADSTFLALPAGVRESVLRRLPGSSFESQRTIALGAILASGHGAAGNAAASLLGDLASMRRSLPKPKPQPIQLALQRLQSPRVAGTVIAASIAAFLLSPLVFAVVRNGILRLKLDDLRAYEAENREVQQKAALYQALSRTTWPMTKLLGDLSNALPDTVDVESIQIETNQRITIKGTAKPTEKPTHMASREVALSIEPRARDTGIFKEFEIKIDSDDGIGCPFTLSCSVNNPIKQYAWKAEEDNAVTTRRDRLYPNWREIEKGHGGATAAASHSEPAESSGGEAPARVAHAGDESEASGDDAVHARTDVPKTARPGSGSRPDSRSGQRPPSPEKPKGEPHEDEVDPTNVKVVDAGSKEGEAAEVEGEKDRPGAASDRGINRRRPEGAGERPTTPQPSAPQVNVPAAFSDDELNGMSVAQAKELLSNISVARGSATLDEETKTRLNKDFYRVLDRLKELQKQKSGS